MAKIRNITDQNRKWINAEVAQRALAFINSACNHDEVINQDKSIGAAVRTLQDSLRSVGDVIAPSGKRITKEVAEARAGLIPETDWIDEEDCDCADRSWYGPEHDSACPLAGRKREERREPNVAAVKLSADQWVEIFYAVKDKLELSPAVKGNDSESKRFRADLRAILKAIGPDGELAAQSEYFDKSETATVLAALRHWQGSTKHTNPRALSPDHFFDVEPLDASAIDALCQRINCGE